MIFFTEQTHFHLRHNIIYNNNTKSNTIITKHHAIPTLARPVIHISVLISYPINYERCF